MHRLIASASAAVLLAVAGAVFHVMEGPGQTENAGPAREISNFPNDLGTWTGRPLRVDDRIIAATDTDAYLSRVYRSNINGAEVGVFLGCGVRVHDLVPHRPTVCYPGAGWTLQSERTSTLRTGANRECEYRIYRFERAGLDNRTITVLNYYIIDGNFYPDVEYLRSHGWERGYIGYVAQVQITSAESSAAEAEAVVSEFARASVDAIHAAAAVSATVRPGVRSSNGK